MAGGLYPGHPFTPNWKCVLFTLVAASLYWFLPPKSILILVLLVAAACGGMAWYQGAYGCVAGSTSWFIGFASTVALLYWFLPPKNVWALVFLLWAPYIGMATYDYSAACADKLQPTAVPFGRVLWLPFKPQGYQDAFAALPPAKIKVMDRVDHAALWTLLILSLCSVSLGGKKILK